MKIQRFDPLNQLSKIEEYLTYHVDAVWGIGSVGMGWSLLLGPDFNHLIQTAFPLFDSLVTFLLGVSLVFAGCILIMISVTDTPWRDSFTLYLGPGFLISVMLIFHELQATSNRPDSLIFFLIASMVVTYLLMRRTGIRP